MTGVSFKVLPVLIPFWAWGQVILKRTVWVAEEALDVTGRPPTDLIAHELRHVMQIEEMGLLRYWWEYIKDSIKGKTHDDHPMENDAREAAKTDRYREAARKIYSSWDVRLNSQTFFVDTWKLRT